MHFYCCDPAKQVKKSKDRTLSLLKQFASEQFLNWKRCIVDSFFHSIRKFIVNKKREQNPSQRPSRSSFNTSSLSRSCPHWNPKIPPNILTVSQLVFWSWFSRLNSWCFSLLLPGSLPPSPADSGVSDVDSSSSGNGQPICSDEIKARLGLSGTTATPNNSGQQQTQLPPPPPGTFLHPNFYHQTAPLRNLWSNRNVSRKFYISCKFLAGSLRTFFGNRVSNVCRKCLAKLIEPNILSEDTRQGEGKRKSANVNKR